MVSEIMNLGNISEINVSLVLPLPGSPMMDHIVRTVPEPLDNEDMFDGETSRRVWIENFCDVSYERLVEEQFRYSQFHQRMGTFGLIQKEALLQTV
jgi:hypothetical protein